MRRRVSQEATIELKDVRAFCAVFDAGSITAAARLVGETKGSVSRRIGRLERTLGVALLRRSPRLVVPTEHGALYRAKVGQALELFDDASRTVEGDQERPRGVLRVTAPSDFAIGLLPELIVRFVERNPDVKVHMVASDQRLDFDAQQLDCALRVGALRDSTLKVHKLLELEMGLYASPAYLASRDAPAKPSDLANHRFIGYVNMPRPFEIALERGGQTSTVTLDPAIVGDGAFVHQAVAAGGGFGGIPRILAAADVKKGRLVPILRNHRPRLERPLSLLYPPSAFVPAKVRAFRDFLLETLAKLGTPRAS